MAYEPRVSVRKKLVIMAFIIGAVLGSCLMKDKIRSSEGLDSSKLVSYNLVSE